MKASRKQKTLHAAGTWALVDGSSLHLDVDCFVVRLKCSSCFTRRPRHCCNVIRIYSGAEHTRHSDTLDPLTVD